jgi:hypothetical protein
MINFFTCLIRSYIIYLKIKLITVIIRISFIFYIREFFKFEQLLCVIFIKAIKVMDFLLIETQQGGSTERVPNIQRSILLLLKLLKY